MTSRTFYPIFFLAMLTCAAQAQVPELTVTNNSQGITIKNLKLDIVITGQVATNTWELTIQNTTDRTLDAILQMPVLPGDHILGYAVAVDGNMREAVAIAKTDYRVAAPRTGTASVKAALLEGRSDNKFSAPLSGIAPGSIHTIRLRSEQHLQGSPILTLNIPFAYKYVVEHCEINVTALRTVSLPVITGSPFGSVSFTKKGENAVAFVNQSNVTPSAPFIISINEEISKPIAFIQQKGNEHFFVISDAPGAVARPRPAPGKITILWDASLSGLARDHNKEFELLGKYFASLNNTSVTLVCFSNRIRSVSQYKIKNGEWKEMQKGLEGLVYDGGTQLALLDTKIWPADEYLLFTDGYSNYGGDEMPAPVKSLFTICAAKRSNAAMLNAIALRSGGVYIDMTQTDVELAVSLLNTESLRLIDVKAEQGTLTYCAAAQQMIGNNICIGGVASSDLEELTLQYGYGSTPEIERKAAVYDLTSETTDIDLSGIVASAQLSAMSESGNDRQEMLRVAKASGIPTRDVSLLVLDNPADYARYGIVPPVGVQSASATIVPEISDFVKQATYYWADLLNWYYGETAAALMTDTVTPQLYTRSNALLTISQPGFLREQVRQAGIPTVPEGYTAMTDKDNMLDPVLVSSRPLIVKENPTANFITKDQIAHSPLKNNIVDIIATLPNIYQRRNGANISIGGARNEGTMYIIDGVQVASNQNINLPSEAIDEIQVLTGNIPAKYGDAVGGVVIINTRRVNGNIFQSAVYDFTPPEHEGWVIQVRKARKSEQYDEYLRLRKEHMDDPAFYFHVGSYFIGHGQKETGLQVLSNMVEIAQADAGVYKMMAYELRESGNAEDAVYAFRKILEQMPNDPQSYRDYGLALAEAGRYQAAFDTLLLSLANDYPEELSGKNNGFQEVVLTEINNLIVLHPDIDAKALPKKWQTPMSIDVRIVLNWNMPNTNMDISVTDPRGKKCEQGNLQLVEGRLTGNIIRSYGPKQFMLKEGKSGKYQLEVSYYDYNDADGEQPPTIQAELYTHYGTSAQKRQLVTLQMNKGTKGLVYIGEVKL